MSKIKPNQPVALTDCSLVKALRIIGERWTLLLLRESFYGHTRFDEMQRNLGISRRVLSERLDAMVKAGLLHRSPYQDGSLRTRYDYRPTQMTNDLRIAWIALMQWGDQYFPHRYGRPLSFAHAATGEEVRAEITTAQGKILTAADQLKPTYWPDRKRKSAAARKADVPSRRSPQK